METAIMRTSKICPDYAKELKGSDMAANIKIRTDQACKCINQKQQVGLLIKKGKRPMLSIDNHLDDNTIDIPRILLHAP
jgi:hypothetical protein